MSDQPCVRCRGIPTTVHPQMPMQMVCRRCYPLVPLALTIPVFERFGYECIGALDRVHWWKKGRLVIEARKHDPGVTLSTYGEDDQGHRFELSSGSVRGPLRMRRPRDVERLLDEVG